MKTTMHILVVSIKRLDLVLLRPYLDILEAMMTNFPLSIVAYMTRGLIVQKWHLIIFELGRNMRSVLH